MAQHRKTPVRRTVALVAGLGLVGTALPAMMATSATADDKIEFAVQSTLESQGEADVWLHFGQRPDMSAATTITDWDAKGQYVFDTLNAAATTSQAAAIAKLDAAGVEYHSFYITNAIKVEGADVALVEDLAALSEVNRVYPEFEVFNIEPADFKPQSEFSPMAPTWGLEDIGAPQVWDEFGVTGEGVTVGVLDTGTDFDHEALVDSYRGNNGDGTFTHDYNWFDAAGTGDDAPLDTDYHGTHVTGTIAGGVATSGDGSDIGVAPGANWIATNGCCPDDVALLDSMEWFLAPTDLDGENPDPAQRPHIINNSWGTTSPSTDPFGEEAQIAWNDAGIFGVFSIGNQAECDTAGAPGSRVINYAVGNYREDHTIHPEFSSRGPGQDGVTKPNIAGPGTDVISSIPPGFLPGEIYGSLTGTSMAAPHVSGSVALIWSYAPELIGDIEGTRALLDASAIDTPDPDNCGGTDENNNTFGEGRLNVYDAIASIEDEPEPPAVEIERIAGADRFEVAANVAAAYPGGADTVYVASGHGYPDALTGSAAAAQGLTWQPMTTPEGDPAPVLLTNSAADRASNATLAALADLDPSNVIVLGGTDSISADVEAELMTAAQSADFLRIEGDNRFEVAAGVAGLFGTADMVYVASGDDGTFADSLSAAAAAGAEVAPVVLVKEDSIPSATSAALDGLEPSQIVLVGGPDTISSEVADELGEWGAVTRIEGANRFEVSINVFADTAEADVIYVAAGRPDSKFADSLTGGALAGSEGAPLLLVQATNVPQVTREALLEWAPSKVVILGGTNTVSAKVESDIAALFTD